MRFIAIIFLLWLAYTDVNAQKYTISGTVLDQNSQAPIGYATVSVYTPDSILISGAITDSLGKFKINGLSIERPKLIIQFIGYQPLVVSPAIDAKLKEVKLPPLLLPPSNTKLKDVEVTGTKENTKVRIDKQVINASQFQNAANGTGLDVLKNMASVTVNTEGEINLRGSDGFMVLVNGKPSTRSAADILGQLPANEIESVEIITSPSAKYEADGKSGIINIITKQNVGKGWFATGNGMFGGIDPLRFGGDLTVGYNAKKWSGFVAGDYRRFNFNGHRIGEVRTIDGDTLTHLPSDGIRNYKDYQYSIRAGGSYAINKTNSLNIGLYYGQKETDRQANLHYKDYYVADGSHALFDNPSATPNDYFFNQNLFVRSGKFFTANVDYNHQFPDKSKLTLLTVYEYSVLGGPLNNQNNDSLTNNLLLVERSTENSPLNSIRAQVDYIKPLKHQLELNMGYQTRYLNHHGNFDFQREDIATGVWQNDPQFSDKLILIQSIQSAYTQLNGSYKILAYTIGLRGEYMRRQLTDQIDSLPYHYNHFDLFPTLQGLLTLKNNQKIKLAYNRRIERPTMRLMAPFKNHRHAETIEVGDPNIVPELSDIVELSYTKAWKNVTLVSTAYYNHVANKIFRLNSIYSRTILLRSYTNGGNTQSAGVECSIDIKATKWLRFYAAGNLYLYNVNGEPYGNTVNENSLAYNFNANVTIDIVKNLKFQWDINYVSKTITAQGNDGYLMLSNASLKYSFLKNQLNVGLKLQNIFDSNSQTITTQTPIFYSSTDYIKYDRILQFTLGFNLYDTNKKVKAVKTDYGEKDF